MWQALIEDLSAIEGVEVLTLRDSRLSRPKVNKVRIIGTDASRFDADYQNCLAASDAAWPIAPEEAGLLESLNRGVMDAGKLLLGCQPEAVHIAASKYATARQLGNAGIEVAPTYASPYLMVEEGPVVAKPDDGAGCQDTLYFPDLTSAEKWTLANGGSGFIFQHFLPGKHLSLSLLCHGNGIQLLSVNRQRITIESGRLRFHGVDVNVLPDTDGRYAELSSQVASAIPGLWGYVGIDLIETEYGPVILEVNPRTTVSYAGLRSALNFNPAAKVLSLPGIQAPCAFTSFMNNAEA